MAAGFKYRHYILKDHLGSWTTITDAEGNVEQELSFDAWGNLRDADTWTGSSTEAPMFDRGYTGHEHMTVFGLINMNGRCYDPLMSSFLSVDAYVQDPSNAQNFNRYAYCLNNPLKYTDPSGWMYLGGSHSPASAQNAERLAVNAALYERQSELKSPGATAFIRPAWYREGELTVSGGGVVIKGNDGVLTPYSIGMRYEGNDSFTSQTVNYLNQVAEKSKTANRMLSELIASGYTYTIEESEDGKNVYRPKEEEYKFIDGVTFYVPGNGTIKFNLKGQKVFEKAEGETTSKLMSRPDMGLMHELGHAWDHKAGVLAHDSEKSENLKVQEWTAIRTENAIRAEMCYPLRPCYGIQNYKDGSKPQPDDPKLYNRKGEYKFTLYIH